MGTDIGRLLDNIGEDYESSILYLQLSQLNKKKDNPQREREYVYVWYVRERKVMKKLPDRS